MNNKVYDNGEMLLGMVADVKKYLFENMEYSDEEQDFEVKGMIEELEELGNNYIVMINYDFGMGYLLYKWHIEVDLMTGGDE
jgi:hypothetical protein